MERRAVKKLMKSARSLMVSRRGVRTIDGGPILREKFERPFTVPWVEHHVRQKDQHRHRWPRLRRRIHSHLSALSERQPVRGVPTQRDETQPNRRCLRHREAVHGVRKAARGSGDRRGAYQHADSGSRVAVDPGAEGRQARGVHRADGDQLGGLRENRRTVRANRQEIHDDGNRGL